VSEPGPSSGTAAIHRPGRGCCLPACDGVGLGRPAGPVDSRPAHLSRLTAGQPEAAVVAALSLPCSPRMLHCRNRREERGCAAGQGAHAAAAGMGGGCGETGVGGL
jgi:hypothetical protein